MHARQAVFPPSSVNFPTAQFWQAVSCDSRKYWLTPQHTPTGWLDEQRKVVPAGQVTPKLAHDVHTDRPVVPAYEPAAQA